MNDTNGYEICPNCGLAVPADAFTAHVHACGLSARWWDAVADACDVLAGRDTADAGAEAGRTLCDEFVGYMTAGRRGT